MPLVGGLGRFSTKIFGDDLYEGLRLLPSMSGLKSVCFHSLVRVNI